MLQLGVILTKIISVNVSITAFFLLLGYHLLISITYAGYSLCGLNDSERSTIEASAGTSCFSEFSIESDSNLIFRF
jgi:hypothetical protein